MTPTLRRIRHVTASTYAACVIAIAVAFGSGGTAAFAATAATKKKVQTTTTPPPALDGQWVAGPRSIAGYRIMERLIQGIGKSEAAGRTEKVAASMSVTRSSRGFVVREVTVQVDMASLTSGDSRRDAKMRTEGLETDKFPTATFEAAAPITVPLDVQRGRDVTVKVKGRLTLHGITRAVDVQLAVGVRGTGVEMVAASTIVLADYGIVPPSNPFVTVDDNGSFEIRLVLERP